MAKTVSEFGRLDILVNNAAEQHPQKSILDVSAEQLEHTFRTNIFAMFHLVKAALPHLKEGSTIVNTTSVTAYRGSAKLLDYSATKGRDRGLHPFARTFARGEEDPRQCSRTRANLDATHPVHLPRRRR